MIREGRNSAAVVKFMADFTNLKRLMDGEAPGSLTSAATQDTGLEQIANSLYFNYEFALKPVPGRMISSVDTAFTVAFREYEESWAEPVSDVVLGDLFVGLFDQSAAKPNGNTPSSHIHRLRGDWEFADVKSKAIVNAIGSAVDQISYEASEDDGLAFEPEFIDLIQEAKEEWDALLPRYEIDVAGMLRRRALLPEVLVPQHVLDQAKGKPLETLKAAQNAFVVGSNQAAIPLMRAVIESIIEMYPRTKAPDREKGLPGKINVARELPISLPHGAPNTISLINIVNRANEVLHDLEDGIGKRLGGQIDREIEMQRLFLILRNLIERVPSQSA